MTYFMHPAQHHLRAITHNSRRAIVIENNRCISSLLIRPYSNSHYLTSSSNIIGYECNELKLHQFLNGEDNLTDTDT